MPHNRSTMPTQGSVLPEGSVCLKCDRRAREASCLQMGTLMLSHHHPQVLSC